MKNNIIYRKATEADCYDIAKLKGIVWNTTYQGIYSDEALKGYDVEKNEKIILQIVNNLEIELYVATDNDTIVGFMTCGKPYKPFRHYEQEVGLLYILKEYQRQGIGAAFLNIARNQVKDAGYEEFMLVVNSKNTNAIKFYLAMGGEIIESDERQMRIVYTLQRKKLLITGANGFLGSRIATYYATKYEVLTPSHKEMDITDEKQVAEVFQKYRPDIVVHCAAISDVGRCERETEESYRINVLGSMNVAKASAEIGAKCIICSSDQVYFGSLTEGAHEEDEVLKPCNVYGQHKQEAEKRCLEINPDVCLLRLSWMYDMKTLREGEHSDFFRNLISQLEREEKLYFPIYDKRGITDVNEVVSNLEKTFKIKGGVYNFGSTNDKDTYHTVYEVFMKLGMDVSRLGMNVEAFRENPRNLCMCQKKAKNAGIYFSTTAAALEDNLIRAFNHWLET